MRTMTIAALVLVAACNKGGAGGTPNLSQECTMNGMGSGACSFTNLGDGTGATCGHIAVVGKADFSEMAKTSVFCSGQLPPKTTSRVEFSVPDVQSACEAEGKAWSEVCSFTFVGEGQTLEGVMKAAVDKAVAAPDPAAEPQ